MLDTNKIILINNRRLKKASSRAAAYRFRFPPLLLTSLLNAGAGQCGGRVEQGQDKAEWAAARSAIGHHAMTALSVFLAFLSIGLRIGALVVAVGALVAACVAVSGWPHLAREYAYTGPPLKGRLYWLMPFLGSWLNPLPTRLGAYQEGLYLCPEGPSRLFAQPVLIPWSRVLLLQEGESTSGARRVVLQAGAEQVPFVVPHREWPRVRIHAASPLV